MQLSNVEDIYPLSPMQQGMLFHTLYDISSTFYFEQFVCTLQGDIRTGIFRKAWQQVVDAHGVLRSCFIMEELNQPMQVVRQQVELPWQPLNWQAFSKVQQQTNLQELLIKDREQGFILDQAPLIRCTLCRISENRYYFVMSHHHCLIDGWSLSLLLREVLNRYLNLCRGLVFKIQPPRHYRDYIDWLQQQDESKAENFWRKTFSEFSAATPLPLHKTKQNIEVDSLHMDGRSESKSIAILKDTQRYHSIQLSPEVTRELENIGKQHRLTVNTLVQGAWALLLSCYSGESDVVFGVTTSGRPVDLSGSDSMIGLFINTLPLRVCIDPDETLTNYLTRLQVQQAEVRQYEYSPLTQVQQWAFSNNAMKAGKQVLFESIIVFENYPRGSFPTEKENGFQVLDVHGIEKTNFPLTVTAALKPDLSLEIAYEDTHFSQTNIEQLINRMRLILESMPSFILQPLKMLPMLSQQEYNRVVKDWNDTQLHVPQNKVLHQLFEEQVEKSPNDVAIIFEQEKLSYQELNSRSNQLSHFLLSLGIGPESLVGICLERNIEMVVGLMAVLKAGAAYVPLDPALPQSRLEFMVEDSNISLLLTQTEWVDKFPSDNVRTICLDTQKSVIAGYSRENPYSKVDTDNPAYVLYTSGSSGQPKAVIIPHRAICNHMNWVQNTFPVSTDEVALQQTPFNFDASMWEFYAPLLSGARLIIARPGGHRDIQYLINTIKEHQVTSLQLVPSLLRLFLDDKNFADCQSLRRVFCGGESLPLEMFRQFKAIRPESQLLNMYGPTETCIDATCMMNKHIDAQQSVPLGRPIANTQVYILNNSLQPLPPGAPGELYIGGRGLARGYCNAPQLTAEKFIPNPFSGVGERLYKTGDLVRFLDDGNIEFLGRIDNQVKIRGFRVELEEVEKTLLRYSKIQACAVMPRKSNNENDSLIAYFVSSQIEDIGAAELRRFLHQILPEHMIPATFVQLNQLPMTNSGKLDRKALPEPDATVQLWAEEQIAPRDLIDLKMVRIWERALKVEPIGITDNYFDLGGHSILAIHLLTEVEREFSKKFPLSVLFEGGTVKHLTDLIRQEEGFIPQSVLVGIQPTGSKPPFYCVHPAGGNVLCYTDLSRCMGADQPFFGLQDPGLIGEHQGFSCIEEMASFYVQQIQIKQPHGPYFIGGWSMGGLVALEMAQQLTHQGEDIALLALIDVAVPTLSNTTSNPHASRVQSMATVIEEIGRARKMNIHISPEVLEELHDTQQIDYIHDQFLLAGDSISKDELVAVFDYAQRYAHVNRVNMEALQNYRPKMFAGQITLLRVDQPDATLLQDDPAYADNEYGWGEISCLPVHVYRVPGEHREMVYDPNAQKLAKALGHCIDKANHPFTDAVQNNLTFKESVS